MVDGPSHEVPEHIRSRVRREPGEYLRRDRRLEIEYRYGDAAESEPIKAIQKEIDGMARLLSAALAADTEALSEERLIEIYEQEVTKLMDLEEEIISELPERTTEE